jgi:hypothetical protein
VVMNGFGIICEGTAWSLITLVELLNPLNQYYDNTSLDSPNASIVILAMYQSSIQSNQTTSSFATEPRPKGFLNMSCPRGIPEEIALPALIPLQHWLYLR